MSYVPSSSFVTTDASLLIRNRQMPLNGRGFSLFGGGTHAADRCAWIPGTVAAATATQIQSRVFYTPLFTPMLDLRLVYVNQPGNAAITVKASIENQFNAIYPVTFSGTRTTTIEPGGVVISDPVCLGNSSSMWVRTLAINPSGTGTMPIMGDAAHGSDSSEIGTTALTDKVDTGGVLSTTNSNRVAPYMVLSQSPMRNPRPTISGYGDSIMLGTGDSGVTAGFSSGFLARACRTLNYGLTRWAVGGEKASDWTTALTGSKTRQYAIASGATHTICNYGFNDYAFGTSLAVGQPYFINFWTALADRGTRVIQTTITPQTSSTDSWTTTGNQTAASWNAVRIAFNDWLRDGAPIDATTAAPLSTGSTTNAIRAGSGAHPLFAVIETADAVETARNSGIWKASWTGDGVHPNATGHAALAALFTSSVFPL
jgi:hypothetical protein